MFTLLGMAVVPEEAAELIRLFWSLLFEAFRTMPGHDDRRVLDSGAVSKRGKGRPHVVALLLADHVYLDGKSKKHVIAGTFSCLNVAQVPAIQSQSALFVDLTDFSGTHELDVRLVRLSDGKQLAKSSPVEVSHTDRTGHLELTIQMPPLRFDEAGWYSIELFWDNVYLARRRLQVIPLEKEDLR